MGINNHPITELYMLVKDADLIRRLMESKGLTARRISRDMGWSSHSYLNRVLNGQVRSVTPDAAVKLAYLLQVPVDLIFVPRVSGDTRQNVRRMAS
ncbi:helix-turn-helix domain-containing protein [Nocardioides sp.]|uniref:helix-turn-helix domain-containing protein n=1 Tax=Nocardioides sp. TaxID=35761 RepID=UPI003513AD70